MTGVLVRDQRGRLETQRGGHVKMGSETGMVKPRTKGTARMASSHEKLGERQGTHPPSEPPERTNPQDTSISDFWPKELCKNKFQLSLAKKKKENVWTLRGENCGGVGMVVC